VPDAIEIIDLLGQQDDRCVSNPEDFHANEAMGAVNYVAIAKSVGSCGSARCS